MIIDAAELKRRHLLRIAGARDNKVYIGPELVTLDITNICNLRCQYCITDHSPGNPDHLNKAEFLSWERFLGLVSDLVDLHVDRLIVTGFGEPSAHPLFRDMMRHLEQQPLKTVLITNGTFPLDHCSDVIRGDEVLINLSAVDRQQYLDLQGKDLFDRVVANIKRLVLLRDEVKPGFNIKINYIVNAANADQKQNMQEMADGLGVNWVEFSNMRMHAYNRKIALPQSVMEDTVSRASRKVFGDPDVVRPDPEEGVDKAPPVCLNGWFYMLVMTSGKLGVCFQIPHMSHGDLDGLSFKEFWSLPRTMDVRLLGKTGHIQKTHKACQTCHFYEENMKRERDLVRLTKEIRRPI